MKCINISKWETLKIGLTSAETSDKKPQARGLEGEQTKAKYSRWYEMGGVPVEINERWENNRKCNQTTICGLFFKYKQNQAFSQTKEEKMRILLGNQKLRILQLRSQMQKVTEQ